MSNTPLFHRITSTSFVVVVSLTYSARPASAVETSIPPMPNACAETVCAVIHASAELACAEARADPDVCETVLAELQRCFAQCSDSQ